jgi:hypothetical protein
LFFFVSEFTSLGEIGNRRRFLCSEYLSGEKGGGHNREAVNYGEAGINDWFHK